MVSASAPAPFSSAELLTLVLDGVPGLIAYVDRTLVYRLVNERYAAWYGLRKEQIIGQSISVILTEKPAYERALVFYRQALAGERVSFDNEVTVAGERRTVSVDFVPYFDQHGIVQGFFALIQDITRLKQTEDQLRAANACLQAKLLEIETLQAELRHQAVHDTLTGLCNRRCLEEQLPLAVAQARQTAAPIGVVMLDLDHFKRVNDVHGHKVGDQILAALGTHFLALCQPGETAYRYGGEEFVLVLPGLSASQTTARAASWCASLHNLPLPYDLRLSLSAGAAVFPQHGATADALVDAADQALYVAKQTGRSRVVLYTP